MTIRKACVAGQFYPGNAGDLEEAVRGFLPADVTKIKARAVISPHAGYIYSGHVAGAVYSAVEIPDDIILIGPNHTGLGKMVSVMTEGEWEIPTGVVRINEVLAAGVAGSSDLFSPDMAAHLGEHSLEVQLPFLYYLNRSVSIVPITIMQAGYEQCREMGAALSRVISGYEKDILIVVSSDMNHYESDEVTREKDGFAIEMIKGLDALGLLEVTSSRGITMCGVLPAAITLAAARDLGAKKAELVKYATSAETSGDFDHVVGYAGFTIS
ncbi:MAG: AmmeMemoRadiSam system protein B [Thermodesulfobacteriota bacterium]|nr:MAG: AmmeMemoRadiSam system protein B [Thermodesulfobacteriota bacterium]